MFRATAWSDQFQVDLPNVYEPFLSGSRFPYTYLDWRLPDGRSIRYERISPGTGYADAVYGAISSDRIFTNSRINWNGFGWDWTLANGTTYLSPEAYNATRPQQGSLVGIFDRNGNEVRLSRDANGELAEIESPGGRWIRFEYGQQPHMIRAKDSAGNVVEYEYDSGDRLTVVRYPGGRTTKYSYDTADRIIKVEDPSEEIELEIKYDSSGGVAELTVDSKYSYNFRYVSDKVSKTTRALMSGPDGRVTQVNIHSEGSTFSYSIQNSSVSER
jgi:YD repeat-containing protein